MKLHQSSERVCLQCTTIVKRRKSTRFGDFPEEDGYIWCSDKCLMLWITIHNVTLDGELITSISDSKTGIEFTVNELTPEDL